jgi:hypothetical protein
MNRTKAQYTKVSKTASVNVSSRHDCLLYGRSIGAVTHSHDQPLTYRRLQAACKAAGVSAKGSTAVLRKRLWEAEFGHISPNPTPLTRRQRQAQVSTPKPVQSENDSHSQFDYAAAYACDTAVTYEVPDPAPEPATSPAPKAPKAPKAPAKRRLSSIGTDYRTTQKLIALWRSEDRVILPSRNSGWDNLEVNLDHVLNDSRFWGWVSTDHGAAALAALGVTL